MRSTAAVSALLAVLLCACAGSGPGAVDDGGAGATPTALSLTGGRTPSPRPASSTLGVKFTNLAAVDPGSYATATIQTTSGARCSIDVEYKSGSSTAAGLGPKTAAANGVVTWRWKVGPKTTPGSWPVTVQCSRGAVVGKATSNLTVR